MHDRVLLAKGGQEVDVYLQKKAPSAVRIAAQNFCRDLERICCCSAFLTQELQNARILIGMIGEDTAIDALAGETLSLLKDEHGKPRWESYLQKLLPDGRLLILGNDRRGTIYGIYDLSRKFGVSPWYYFADVPVRQREEISLPADYENADWPSVQYRGIFLNDEEELNAWAKLHTTDGTIGPATYRSVFELILRLKGNYIWPAMHVNAFNFIEEEGKLCLEAEYALAESPSAWSTPDRDGRVWEHLSAETDGGPGLSMMVEEPDLYWEKNGPALHFRGLFTGGTYYSYFPLDNAS